jgi:hypothetical protein
MTRYDRLWRAIDAAQSPLPPAGAELTAIHAQPPIGTLPSPWVTWTLIGLVRHLRRQLWVGEVVTSRLGGDLEMIAHRGALGHPRGIKQSGLVPGVPDWEYFFHGRGCGLKHRGTGELIDVDFFGPAADGLDAGFYLEFLRSLHDPESPEKRLVDLHPSIEPIRLAIAELFDDGLLVPVDRSSGRAFRLSEKLLDQAESIDIFCREWERAERRIHLAASIGDWLAAHDEARALNREDAADILWRRSTACRAKRCDDLVVHRDVGALKREALLALDDLDAEVLTDSIASVIRAKASGEIATAIEIIRRRNDPAWCPAVHDFLLRLDSEERALHSGTWLRCVEFLLRHRHHFEEICAELQRAGGTAIGAAALLALEYAPDSALPLFRRALRCPIPVNRNTAAAVLALIDQEWSRQELLAVLEESDDEVATCECRAALRDCHDRQAHRSVEKWERKNHREPEPADDFTMKEVMLRHGPQWMQYEMEKLHDRVMKVRYRRPIPAAGHP